MSTLDWGNVPGWLGSILSGASLLLGLSILRRDHLIRERDQVSQVSFSARTTAKREEGKLRVTVRALNASDLPVHDVEVTVVQQAHYFSPTETLSMEHTLDFELETIDPHQTKKDWAKPEPPRRYPDRSFVREEPDNGALMRDGTHSSWSTDQPLRYEIKSRPIISNPSNITPIDSNLPSLSHGRREIRYGGIDLAIGYDEPRVSATLTDYRGYSWEVITGKAPILLKRTARSNFSPLSRPAFAAQGRQAWRRLMRWLVR